MEHSPYLDRPLRSEAEYRAQRNAAAMQILYYCRDPFRGEMAYFPVDIEGDEVMLLNPQTGDIQWRPVPPLGTLPK